MADWTYTRRRTDNGAIPSGSGFAFYSRPGGGGYAYYCKAEKRVGARAFVGVFGVGDTPEDAEAMARKAVAAQEAAR